MWYCIAAIECGTISISSFVSVFGGIVYVYLKMELSDKLYGTVIMQHKCPQHAQLLVPLLPIAQPLLESSLETQVDCTKLRLVHLF